MTKKHLLLFCIFCLIPLTGCWDVHELNQISIVTGVGIDKGENYTFNVTVEILNAPALEDESGGNQTTSIVFSMEGDSIAEAVKKMNVYATRKLVFSHLRAVILHTDIGNEGFLNFLEFFESDREIRNDFNFAVVDNVKAGDLLKVKYPIQKVSSLKVNSQLQTMVQEWGGDPDIRLKSFISALLSPGREPVLSQLKVEGAIEKGNEIENITKVTPDTYVALEGLAVFKGMTYLGVVPISTSRNFLLLNNKLKKTSLTVFCDDNLITTARIHDSITNVKASYQDGRPHFQIDIDLEGRLETTQCPDDFSHIETYLNYEKKFSEGLNKDILESIKLLQEEYQADIFGFGEYMERQNYQQFQKVKDNWNEEFAKAEFDLRVKVRLRRSGLTSRPFTTDVIKDEDS